MVMKRSVFGTYVNDGVPNERKETEQRRNGFRTPPRRKIKLKNPFHIYNIIFNYNKDYTKVPTTLKGKKE
jgi:hypothetical protein